MTITRDRQALRLLTMISRLRARPVDTITRKEWLAVTRLVQILVREFCKVDERAGFDALNGLVMRGMRDGLPIPRENERLDEALLHDSQQ